MAHRAAIPTLWDDYKAGGLQRKAAIIAKKEKKSGEGGKGMKAAEEGNSMRTAPFGNQVILLAQGGVPGSLDHRRKLKVSREQAGAWMNFALPACAIAFLA